MSSLRVGGTPNSCRTRSVVYWSNLWLKSWPPSLLFPAGKYCQLKIRVTVSSSDKSSNSDNYCFMKFYNKDAKINHTIVGTDIRHRQTDKVNPGESSNLILLSSTVGSTPIRRIGEHRLYINPLNGTCIILRNKTLFFRTIGSYYRPSLVTEAVKHITCHGSGEKHASLFVEQRNVQRSSTEVDHQHVEHVYLVQAVSHGCSRGLIDHAQDLQAYKTKERMFTIC